MKRTVWLLILQGIGVTLQMINVSLTDLVESPKQALLIAAIIGGYQFIIQHLGNITEVKK